MPSEGPFSDRRERPRNRLPDSLERHSGRAARGRAGGQLSRYWQAAQGAERQTFILTRMAEGWPVPEPWILEASDQLTLVRRLERALSTLEEAGCRVGIGVATGADHCMP